MRHFILLFLIVIILILIIRNNENIIEGQYEYSLDSDSILPDISISKDISPDDASTSNSLLDSNAWINSDGTARNYGLYGSPDDNPGESLGIQIDNVTSNTIGGYDEKGIQSKNRTDNSLLDFTIDDSHPYKCNTLNDIMYDDTSLVVNDYWKPYRAVGNFVDDTDTSVADIYIKTNETVPSLKTNLNEVEDIPRGPPLEEKYYYRYHIKCLFKF